MPQVDLIVPEFQNKRSACPSQWSELVSTTEHMAAECVSRV